MDNNFHKKFFFIAIGGIGMSGLAKYLLEMGCSVSGSDIKESKYTKKMEALGAKVYIGHDAKHIEPDMIVVASTAIKYDNPEKIRAKELGLEVLHRSDVLKMISEGLGHDIKQFIGFSGTHGKTTTSGLCSYVLKMAGYEPSYCVGGIIPGLDTNAEFGKGSFFVAELDESDGTIVKYHTNVSVINNLEVDHVDFYKNGFEDLLKTFRVHIDNRAKDGKIIVNKDCNGIKKLIAANPDINFLTFGIDSWDVDYTAKNIRFTELGSEFDVYYKTTKLIPVKLIIPGKHNIYNTLAVIAALHQEGVDLEKIRPHFETFTGMGRRFQKVAEFDAIRIFDDYAHHPTEIKTTLESAKLCEKDRLVAIFQPHRYTRLKGLWNDFLKSFDTVDKLIIVDVYSASENPIEGIDSKTFAQCFKNKDVTYISGSMENAARKILPLLKSGDMVITLGAGDVTRIGAELLKLHKEMLPQGISCDSQVVAAKK